MIKLYSKINCGLGPAMQKWGRVFKLIVVSVACYAKMG